MKLISRMATVAAVGLLSFAGASANAAAVLSVSELGIASNTAVVPLLGSGVSITDLNNAPIVNGGGVNNGSIVSFNLTGLPSGLGGQYSDGSTGWNPFGVNGASQWLSIGGSGGGTFNSSATAYATFSFASPQTSFSFVWGSSSVTNTVTLFDANGISLGTVSANGGSQLFIDGSSTPALSTSDLANVSSAGPIIDISSSVAFKTAVLSTDYGTGGFEVGGVSAVPLPAAFPLFGAALMGLGGLGLRKKARKTV
jgi:hypothetical protein